MVEGLLREVRCQEINFIPSLYNLSLILAQSGYISTYCVDEFEIQILAASRCLDGIIRGNRPIYCATVQKDMIKFIKKDMKHSSVNTLYLLISPFENAQLTCTKQNIA